MSEFIKVTDPNAQELDIFSRVSESALKHLYEPFGGVFIAESPNVTLRALAAGYEPVCALIEESHVDGQAKEVIEKLRAHKPGPVMERAFRRKFVPAGPELDGEVKIYTAERKVFEEVVGFMTRGMLCVMLRKPLQPIREICEGCRRVAVLEDVENPTNVGAIIRSAAALNIDAVLLSATCSDPLYRRAARVSMGTVFQVPWTIMNEETGEWPQPAMSVLAEMGFKTAAMALTDNSVSIDDEQVCSEEKLAIILGSEGMGMRQETIDACDYTVKIPMRGGVDSLNVAAASAVAFWQLH